MFGTSTNPPHLGHLQGMQTVLELDLSDQVLLVPCGKPAHKILDGDVDDQVRIDMAYALVADCPEITVDLCEFQRQGPSLTADTLVDLHRRYPDDQLQIIVGYDQAVTLHTWDRWQEIVELAELLILTRHGHEEADVRSSLNSLGARFVIVEREIRTVSSTQIRKAIAAGMPIENYVGENVAAVINKNNLYSPATAKAPSRLI